MAPQTDRRVSVAVVGAGLSGIHCARRLHEEGVDVAVVEARDRVGGRTLSRWCSVDGAAPDSKDGVLFEHGAQWIGPAQHRVMSLADELGLTRFDQFHEGTKVVRVDDGRLRHYRGSVPRLDLATLLALEIGQRRLDRMAKGVPLVDPSAARDAAALDGQNLADYRARMLPHRRARALFDVATRIVFGAEPSQLSALYFLFYVNAAGGFRRLIDIEGGAQQWRLVEGTQALSTRSAERLGLDRVLLDAPVRCIRHSDDGVVVEHARGCLRADRVVLAVPPPLAAKILFEPALPRTRSALLANAKMGATVKVMGVYPRKQWRERGLSGEAVCTEGPLSCVFDASPAGEGLGCLLGFAVGRDALHWSAAKPAERRRRALASFEALLGVPASSAVGYVEQDWSLERWTDGCPVASLGAGSILGTERLGRERVGRLHWAGTETARHWCGYLEGALEAAERAAGEVLTFL
jgi:monoamine oxidase